MPLGSTYRLQVQGVGFAGARALVGYLAQLGVQTLYLSPIWAAVPGTTHGYDVVDPRRLDPALGTRAELEQLLDALAAHDMRLLVDIVPNHMATDRANGWWWDLLRRGRSSPYAPYFDVDWSAHGGRVLLAILTAPLRAVLEHAVFDVVRAGTGRELAWDGQRTPLDPKTGGGRRAPLPIDVAALLDRQHYRLAYWRTGRSERNYRCFFDVDSLVGVRVEDRAVYDATHELILALAADRRIAGVRVDHVDGLSDPGGYLAALRADLDMRRVEPATVVVEKILARDEALPGWRVEGTTGYEFADLAGGLLVDPAGAASIEDLGRQITGERRSFDEIARDTRRYVLGQLFVAELARLARLAAAAIEETTPGADLAVPDLWRALRELTVHLEGYRTYLDGKGTTPADRRRIDRASAGAEVHLDAEGARALHAVATGLAGARLDNEEDPSGRWLELARRWQQLTGAVAAKGVEDTATYRFDGLLVGAEVGGDPAVPALDASEFHRQMATRRRRFPASLNATSTHDSKRSEDVRARLSVLSEVPDEWSTLVRRWRRRHRSLLERLGGAPDAHDELVVYQTIVGVWPLDAVPDVAQLRRRIAAYAQKAAREAKVHTSWTEPNPRYERALEAFVGALLGRAGTRFCAEVSRLVGRIGPAAATNSLVLCVLKALAPGVPDLYQGTELWDFSLVDPDNRRPVDFAIRQRLLDSLPSPSAPSDERHAALSELRARWSDGRIKLYVNRVLLELRGAEPELFAAGRYMGLEITGPRRRHVIALARQRGRSWALAVLPLRTAGWVGASRFATGTDYWEGTSVRMPRWLTGDLTDIFTGSSLSTDKRAIPVGSLLDVLPVCVLRSP